MKQSTLVSKQEKQAALDVLNCQIRRCEKCSLSFTRKHALIGEGDINAHILLIALSPGEKEDLTNQMFIGPSGLVLNKLFLYSGIERDMLYMTNLIKCMLPKSRKPKMSEIFPLPHPASLLYNPSYEPDTREKYKKLAAFL